MEAGWSLPSILSLLSLANVLVQPSLPEPLTWPGLYWSLPLRSHSLSLPLQQNQHDPCESVHLIKGPSCFISSATLSTSNGLVFVFFKLWLLQLQSQLGRVLSSTSQAERKTVQFLPFNLYTGRLIYTQWSVFNTFHNGVCWSTNSRCCTE